jgi:outer membrane protein OmpA-like peptidoglycan-associated protein
MREAAALSLVLALGCATVPEVAPEPPPATGQAVLRAPELARIRCLVVAPFENASDVPLAADGATGAILAGIDPSRAKVLPVPELRALFRDTAFELPEGIGPSLALELGQLLGADASMYGAVEGRAAGTAPTLLVTVRLAMAGEHDLLFAATAEVKPRSGEAPEAAVRRTVAEIVRPVLPRLGAPGKFSCFDRERQARLRALALADARAGANAAPPAGSRAALAPAPATSPHPVAGAPAPVAAATAAAPAPASAAAAPPPRAGSAARTALPRTPRQADWARRLGDRGRFVIEEVAFKGRTATVTGDAGLADLAAALAAAPGVKIRIEGFVDATSDPGGDAKLSMSMAQAAGQRLVALGVGRDRVSWAGRGGESPLLPNFTARGRAANRRVEAVGLR